jgi:hypothetical protein
MAVVLLLTILALPASRRPQELGELLATCAAARARAQDQQPRPAIPIVSA